MPFNKKVITSSLRAQKKVQPEQIQSTLALRTPRYNGHPEIRLRAKSQAKINYRRLTEMNSRYYGLSLMRTLTRGPNGVRNKGSITVPSKETKESGHTAF